MNLKKWFKSIQTAGYNGLCMVYQTWILQATASRQKRFSSNLENNPVHQTEGLQKSSSDKLVRQAISDRISPHCAHDKFVLTLAQLIYSMNFLEICLSKMLLNIFLKSYVILMTISWYLEEIMLLVKMANLLSFLSSIIFLHLGPILSVGRVGSH